MSIQTMKKEILELKRAAALKNESAEDLRIKNMTDEELRQAIEEEILTLGFESADHFYECAKKFILEKDEHANVTHIYAISDRIFELFKDCNTLKEFMLKYSSVEWTE